MIDKTVTVSSIAVKLMSFNPEFCRSVKLSVMSVVRIE